MSLLLQALQKAAKSREEGDADLSRQDLTMSDGLSLEPSTPAPRGSPEPPSTPTPAQAATVVQAGRLPAFDPLEYAREHYMLTFIGLAVLFAVCYGTYVYLQVNRPFRSSTSPSPSPLAAAPAPQIPAASSPPPSSAKISGLPGATSSSASTDAPVAIAKLPPAFPEQQSRMSATSLPEEPVIKKQQKKIDASAKPVQETAEATRRQIDPTPLADASDSIETVVIPSSRSKPASDISVRHDPARVSAVSPTLMQAYEALQSGDNARAKGLYEQVLQADPRNLDVLLGLGAIALSAGHVEEASQYYQRVLELDPRNSYAQAGLISIVGGADLQASESRLKQLIGRDPSAFLYFSLGNLYAEQAQWPSAQQAYFQAFQMQPDNPDYAFNLAIGLEHLSQHRLALDYYRKALDLSFKKGHANFDQSLVIQRVGQLSTRVEQ